MAKQSNPTVRLDPPVNEHLAGLKHALQADMGLKATRDEIVTALVHGANPAHAAWMLIAYNQHAAAQEDEGASGG